MDANITTSELQKAVAVSVEMRGYRKGWSHGQFLARQMAKMMEELSESARVVSMPGELAGIELVGKRARMVFDIPGYWDYVPAVDVDKLKKELADMQVVLFNLADALGAMDGEPFDVVMAAVDKSQADVGRGVR